MTAAACLGRPGRLPRLALLGSRLLEKPWSDQLGVGFTANTARVSFSMVVAVAFIWLLLWAVYRWGPPVPVPEGRTSRRRSSGSLLVDRLRPIAFSLFPGRQLGSTIVVPRRHRDLPGLALLHRHRDRGRAHGAGRVCACGDRAYGAGGRLDPDEPGFPDCPIIRSGLDLLVARPHATTGASPPRPSSAPCCGWR